MKNLSLISATALTVTAGLVLGISEAASALTWSWSYSGVGISANGWFITEDIADDQGFFLITEIIGTRNGETITGLQAEGTPIPGNEPFEVDNLIRLAFPQLTGDGFGFSTESGSFASPFFASFLATPGYLEVFSAAPFIPGFENFGPEDSELPITFTASIVNVPEPTSLLSFLALGTLGLVFKRKQSQ